MGWGVVNFFLSHYLGGMTILAQDTFNIEYHMYNDLTRRAMKGENTVGIRHEMDWTDKWECSVSLYAGIGKPLVHGKGSADFHQGIRSRSDLAKVTGWDQNKCKDLTSGQLYNIESLFKQGTNTQNKLTRLVKGFLVYLDCMEHGVMDIDWTDNTQEVTNYTPSNVAAQSANSNTAFIYCSTPESSAHLIMCHLMGAAYPNPFSRNRHVHVPADGRQLRIVAPLSVTEDVMPIQNYGCLLFAHTALASIYRYAMDMDVVGDIESAFVIACTLTENKYFSEFALPKVVSRNDLIAPVFQKAKNSEVRMPEMKSDYHKVVGRLHQLCMFAVTKDIITAAVQTTREGNYWYNTAKQFLTTYGNIIKKRGNYVTQLPMLTMTNELRWLDKMDQGDCMDIVKRCGLDGLWLCDRTKTGIKSGLFHIFKNGRGDRSPNNPYVRILVDELAKNSIELAPYQLPTAEFSLEGVAIMVNRKRKPRKVGRYMVETEGIYGVGEALPKMQEVRRRGAKAVRFEGSDPASSPRPSERSQESRAISVKPIEFTKREISPSERRSRESTSSLSSGGLLHKTVRLANQLQAKVEKYERPEPIDEPVVTPNKPKVVDGITFRPRGSMKKDMDSMITEEAMARFKEREDVKKYMEQMTMTEDVVPAVPYETSIVDKIAGFFTGSKRKKGVSSVIAEEAAGVYAEMYKRPDWKENLLEELSDGLDSDEAEHLRELLEPVTDKDKVQAALRKWDWPPSSTNGTNLMLSIAFVEDERKKFYAEWAMQHDIAFELFKMDLDDMIMHIGVNGGITEAVEDGEFIELRIDQVPVIPETAATVNRARGMRISNVQRDILKEQGLAFSSMFSKLVSALPAQTETMSIKATMEGENFDGDLDKLEPGDFINVRKSRKWNDFVKSRIDTSRAMLGSSAGLVVAQICRSGLSKEEALDIATELTNTKIPIDPKMITKEQWRNLKNVEAWTMKVESAGKSVYSRNDAKLVRWLIVKNRLNMVHRDIPHAMMKEFYVNEDFDVIKEVTTKEPLRLARKSDTKYGTQEELEEGRRKRIQRQQK